MSMLADLQKRYGGQITPRVAYGLVALFAIGLFLLVTELRDRSDTMAQSVSDMQAELRMLKDDASATMWGERATEAAAAKAAWEETDWTAETPGIASAEIQAALTGIANPNGFLDPRVQVSADTMEINGRRVLRFEMAGGCEPGNLMKTIVGISTYPKRLVINEITTAFNQGGQVGLVTVIGYATYRGAAPPADGAQAAQQAGGGAP